jgi:hypothetical protein
MKAAAPPNDPAAGGLSAPRGLAGRSTALLLARSSKAGDWEIGRVLRREWKEYEPVRDLLITWEARAYWMPSDSDRPSQVRTASSAAAAGGVHPHCVSPPGWPPDSRQVAVRFHDRRPGCTGFAPSARFHGPADICYAQGASDRDGRDAARCFLDGTAVPLRHNPELGSAPAACCDRNGVRPNRITERLKRPGLDSSSEPFQMTPIERQSKFEWNHLVSENCRLSA